MYAERIMNSDLPAVKPEDPAGRVLHLMDEYKVRHLPLVNGDEFSGLIYEDDVINMDEEMPMAAFQARAVYTTPKSHLYDVVGQLVAAEVDALPVVDEGTYKGCVNAASVVHFLAEQSHWAARGGVVILEVPEGDLSISEVARLAEDGGTRVIACTTSNLENSSNVEVTLKVETEDIEPVIQTFQRFGYSIQSFFHAPQFEEEMRERYDAFMRFLKQ
ncbi:MAG TPA: hypothetical protein DD635_06445 [Flavobacteriales bacterium]|nr:hypothetical protein [Flavobacteriales bacterium]|tara:strand:+ start:10236 stop:10886 length:651 start_codon:yes stop_codon:yes gene_type:complete